MDGIEVEARRDRDMGLFEHLLGELETVGGEIRDVRIEIECTVGRQKPGQAGLGARDESPSGLWDCSA